MKIVVTWLTLLAFALFFGSAVAVPPGKTVDWTTPMGKVTFDGKAHAAKGLKCPDCHTKPATFTMKKEAKMTMADLNAGKFCGTCHNGEKAFKTSDPAACAKCHKK
jgi:c(7)-type cytochrome triheme protein